MTGSGDDKVGICPKCGSYDCWCAHETMEANRLAVWSECSECGHQFVEVFERVDIKKWEDFK